MARTGTAPARRNSPPLAGARSLDDLAALDPEQLMTLYRSARTPRIADLDGRLTGRMLASPLVRSRVMADFLKRFAAGGPMPWQGKTFTPLGPDRGEGINRVFGNRASWYRFSTSIGRSRAGEFDALQLDYDLEANPFFIRSVKDELREVTPGLWLGIAYLHTPRKDRLGLYFGLADGRRRRQS